MSMKKKEILLILTFFISMIGYTQETTEKFDDINYDFGTAKEITIYGERPKEYESESKNAYVINHINGSLAERKQFIETDFLGEAGFRRNGNVRYRETSVSEKALSVLSGTVSLLTLGLIPIPVIPFFGIEYDKLPKGKFYNFEQVFVKSNFKDVTPEVLTVMELEYMLQIEFCNGMIIQNSSYTNINYYTDENINKFERLILGLPDFPESIHQAKNRYLNELQKIKAALERYKNPSEKYLRAVQNVGDGLKQ
jgi:hypothetical protein